MRSLLSALLVLLLTCGHGPLTAAMPHDFAESHHAGGAHHSPRDHHDDDVPAAVQFVDATEAPSGQSPAPVGAHHHLVADAVPHSNLSFANFRSVGPRKLPANDPLLAQDDLSLLLEPPIA